MPECCGRVTDKAEVILKSALMGLRPAPPTMCRLSRLKNSQNTSTAHCRTFRTPIEEPNHIFARIQFDSNDDEEFQE